MFSAVKHQGQRLYELARKGIEVERKTRKVRTLKLDLTRWEPPILELEVECSHGFYARSLAHDYGKALGTVAHLSGLVRTRSGRFAIKESHTLDEVQAAADEGDWKKLALPIDFTLDHLPAIELDPIAEESVRHGQALSVAAFGAPGRGAKPGQRARAYGDDGKLIAILVFEPQKLGWRPEKVLAPA